MENIGTIISILVGLVTLLSMLVWFGRFIQRVNVHDKKLDEVSSDMYDRVSSSVFQFLVSKTM